METDGEDVTVVDMEAGLEHLKRGTSRHTDVLLAVAEPFFRSAETALRTAELGGELEIPRVAVVANKVRDETDERMVRRLFEQKGFEVLATVPYDDVVAEADRRGVAPVDVDPASPAVRAVANVAAALEDGKRGTVR